MKRLHNFNTWKKINETIDTGLPVIFLNMTKSIVSGINTLTSKFEEMFDKKPESISLIFPKEGWETKAVNLLKKLGVVTGVFKSTNEAVQAIKALKNKGIKAKELVIGSHGDGSTLLITQKEGTNAKKYSQDLLKNAKEIIDKDSKVFFTACHGADYLMNLVDSANTLGVGVYGSKGIYDYIRNSSEEGYYYCKPYQIPKPKKVTEPRDKFYSGKLELTPSGFSREKSETLKLKFFGPFGKDPQLKILFSPSSFSALGWKLGSKDSLTFDLSKEKVRSDEEDYGTKDAKEVYEYEFILDYSDFSWERALTEIGFTSLANLMKSGKFKWPDSKQKAFGLNLKKCIENGSVKIMIGNVDLAKERPQIKGYRIDEITFDNNKHLLKCGACKKINEAPVSWVKKLVSPL
jgi:hypothetical protein